MTTQQAAIYGSVLGLILRSVLPFLVRVWKHEAKLTDFDFAHLKSAVIGVLMGGGTSIAVPAWLSAHGIPETSAVFTPFVLVGCAGVVYFSQDMTHEAMKPKVEQ